MSLAFLYPGQGSQRPDMLRALPASPAVTRTLDEAALELDHTRWPAGLDDISGLIRETRIESLSQPERPRASLEGHRRIAEAVRRQDPVEAAQAMAAHIRLVSDVALLRDIG